MFSDPLVEKLAAFVRSIGIEGRAGPLDAPTFLPGIDIRGGAIVIDEPKLTYPGDILHEAGHIAVSDPATRKTAPVSTDPGEEMAASAVIRGRAQAPHRSGHRVPRRLQGLRSEHGREFQRRALRRRADVALVRHVH